MNSAFNSNTFTETASKWSTETKITFCEKFLYGLPIVNRAIWSDDSYSKDQQVNMLKWSNELNHRVWNILLELKRGKDDRSMAKLLESLKFSGENAKELLGHLGANLKSSYEKMQK